MFFFQFTTTKRAKQNQDNKHGVERCVCFTEGQTNAAHLSHAHTHAHTHTQGSNQTHGMQSMFPIGLNHWLQALNWSDPKKWWHTLCLTRSVVLLDFVLIGYESRGWTRFYNNPSQVSSKPSPPSDVSHCGHPQWSDHKHQCFSMYSSPLCITGVKIRPQTLRLIRRLDFHNNPRAVLSIWLLSHM